MKYKAPQSLRLWGSDFRFPTNFILDLIFCQSQTVRRILKVGDFEDWVLFFKIILASTTKRHQFLRLERFL
jgi:hypothetical protein